MYSNDQSSCFFHSFLFSKFLCLSVPHLKIILTILVFVMLLTEKGTEFVNQELSPDAI